MIAAFADLQRALAAASGANASSTAASGGDPIDAAVRNVLRIYDMLVSAQLLATGGGASSWVDTFVSNAGKVEHEFVVVKTSKPASDLLKGGEADETGNVGEIGSVKPGQTKALKLKLAAGHYALLCNLPGHYAAGQYADLTVK